MAFWGEQWIDSPLFAKTSTHTITYNVATSDDLVIFDTTITSTATLPVATGSGKILIIKNINTGIVTVDGNGSDTIDDDATQTLPQYSALQIIDYASNKWITT